MTTTTKLAALLAAGALLLGACSDGDDATDNNDGDDTTETTEASSPDSTAEGPSINPDAPEAGSQFCQGAAELMTTSGDTGDEAAMDFADSLEPPDEIADEWRSMLDATRAVSEADASGDPEAGQKAMETYQAVQADITKVLEYLQGQCGIDAGV